MTPIAWEIVDEALRFEILTCEGEGIEASVFVRFSETKMMNFMLRYSTPLILISFLSGCASVDSSDGVMKAETRTGGFMGMETKESIEVEYPQGFAGVTKVLIGGFKVGFNDSKKLQNKNTGMFQSGVSQTGLVKLDGIDQATRQKITDEMYENFVQTLKKNGYQIVARSEFTSLPSYKDVELATFPYEDDNSSLFSSYGVGYFYSPSQIGPKQPFFNGERKNPGMLAGFSAMGIMNAVSKFSEVSDARIINVSYVVDFAAASSGDFLSAPLQVGQVLAVDSAILGISKGKVTGFQTASTGQLTLGQPVASELAFAQIKDDTSAVESGSMMAVNVVSGYLSGGLTGALRQTGNQTREYVFVADKEKYSQAAIDVLTRTNVLLADKMAALR